MTELQIVDDSFIINGKKIPTSDVLVADTQNVEDFPRFMVMILFALICPIIMMYCATLLNGPGMEAIRLISSLAFGPGAIAVACVLGIMWKKPWGVVLEIKDKGYIGIRQKDKEAALELEKKINEAIS